MTIDHQTPRAGPGDPAYHAEAAVTFLRVWSQSEPSARSEMTALAQAHALTALALCAAEYLERGPITHG